jgi:integrase
MQKMTVVDTETSLMDFWLYLVKSDMAEGTKRSYFLLVRKTLRHCRRLSLETVNTYCHQVSRELTTQNKYISAFKKYGKMMGLDWCDKLKRRREAIKPHGLLLENEIESALSTYGQLSRDGIFITVFAFTAARPGEIAKLTTDDVDKTEHTLTFWHTKNGTNRRIKIPRRCRIPLYTYLDNLTDASPYLFPTIPNPSKHTSLMTQRDRFYLALEKIGIDYAARKQRGIKFYHLKHACITRLKQGGVDILELKDITGHKKLDSLLHYYQADLKLMDRNFDKDPLARKYLQSDDKYEQTVSALTQIEQDLLGDSRLRSQLVKKNGEITLKIKLLKERKKRFRKKSSENEPKGKK